jgi:hypothetical protein
MLVFRIPLSFFLPLIVHILAGLTTVITGIVAGILPKRQGRHPSWGERYLWAYTLVFFTATILSVERWSTDAYLIFIALVGYGFALGGSVASRFRREPWLMCLLGKYWVIAHVVGTIGSYIVLLTGFYVDNAHLIPLLNHLPQLTCLRASHSDRDTIHRPIYFPFCAENRLAYATRWSTERKELMTQLKGVTRGSALFVCLIFFLSRKSVGASSPSRARRKKCHEST